MAAAAAMALEVLGRGLVAPKHLSVLSFEASTAWPTTEAQFAEFLHDAEVEFFEWKQELAPLIDELRATFSENGENPENIVSFIDTVVEAISAKIENEKAALKSDEKIRKRIVKLNKSQGDDGWFLKFHDNFTALARKWNNERIGFYYRLIALRADYDPNARGGPTFNDTKSLNEFLSSIKPS
ncbi:hypothetical protein HNR00_000120 [Methylorubrum rhodinum]|uniref:Uncharacterized protein n=1 Tax=Methylorubrum rhodinum TaxID=29428 RepID=A0A840ZEF0_9HYPH|nr:hypothetical protein [Methylorubrum rhodinum]MBB5755431.1 hypothetical protein [Methylorubrum rhodinum]